MSRAMKYYKGRWSHIEHMIAIVKLKISEGQIDKVKRRGVLEVYRIMGEFK